jgi:hypothetical protein
VISEKCSVKAKHFTQSKTTTKPVRVPMGSAAMQKILSRKGKKGLLAF